MADVKISAAADIGTVVATDKVPVARSASTTAYAATIAELATYANGAYVPSYFGGSPSMDGTAAPGTSALVGRGDHVHPTDTSRYAASNPSGYQTAAQVQAALRNPNYADNSGFSVNQRVYASGTALAAGAFGHDRWKGGAGGCTYTFTQSSGPATTITITAGTLQQVVEGASLAAGTYMLSWTGTAQGRVGAGSYAASPVTASGIVAGTNTTIEFNTGTLGTVKFEAGTVATPWVASLAQAELGNCQRFYQVGSFQLYQTATAGWYQSTMIGLPVSMRATPALTPTFTSTTNATSPTLIDVSLSALLLYCTATATAQTYLVGTFGASADL